jgi:ATP-dependent DNA ligase
MRSPTALAGARSSSSEGNLQSMKLPVMPPVAPMLAKPVKGIPPGQLYEPKWDGFRSIVFRDGDEVELGSRNERNMTRYFPELVEAIVSRTGLPERCVVDGEIVVPAEGGSSLDFWSLQQRVHPAASRVNMLAERTPARLIVFDLLALGDRDLTAEPFAERRALLEDALAAASPSIHLTPITDDEQVAARWFEQFEGAGLDGLIAKRRDLTYQPNKRVMSKVKHVRTADCVVAGYRLHRSANDAVGSLLLGLYDDPEESVLPNELREWMEQEPQGDGPSLISVGVVGAFPMARRRELLDELQPLVTTFDDHPWHWAADMAAAQRQGAGHRWDARRDLSFVPLRPERVVEVRYDYMDGFRFRHTAQFVRWRPDRDPLSCGYAQLDQPEPFELGAILGRH